MTSKFMSYFKEIRRENIYLITGAVILFICITGCEPKIKNVTVRIDGRVPGSGVIIGKRDNRYDVLVAKHTIATPPGEIDTPYSVITVDGEKYNINDYQKQIQPDSTLDLAIVSFTSQKNYAIAEISSNPIKKDAEVVISGWKACIEKPNYEITKGKIMDMQADDVSEKDKKDGYSLKYSNSTVQGMSGSPVFDNSAKLIAIHGMPGSQKGNSSLYDLNKCSSLEQSSDGLLGSNFGIPMQVFLDSTIGKKFAQ